MEAIGTVIIVLILVIVGIVVYIGLCALMYWRVFEKAGRNGWISIIPFYNNWVLYEISGKPGWWMVFMFIPYVGGVISIILSIIAFVELSKRFGKGGGFAVGLVLLGIVFFPILGFGDAQYMASPETMDESEDILDAGEINDDAP